MTRLPAPVSLSGGQGFNFEDEVAARFLVILLSGLEYFGRDFGCLAALDWQAREGGWLLDDLVLTFRRNAETRSVAISIKSDRQVTENGFPEDFVHSIWSQWLGVESNRFQRETDLLGLVVGQLANGVSAAWDELLRECIATTPDRILSRANEHGAWSQLRKRIFESLKCPAVLDVEGTISGTDHARIAKQVRLIRVDFGSEPSLDRATAIAECQALLSHGNPQEAGRLWGRLVGIAAEMRGAGGHVDLVGVLSKLRNEFELKRHPDFTIDWHRLSAITSEELTEFRSDIANSVSLLRVAALSDIRQALSSSQITVVIGDSGAGKSGVVRILSDAQDYKLVILTHQSLESSLIEDCERLLGISHSVTEILLSSPTPIVLVVDACERLSERAMRRIASIAKELYAGGRAEHVRILLTTQFEASTKLIRHLAELGFDGSKVMSLTIRRPSYNEIKEIVLSASTLTWLALRVELRGLLTNLKVLDCVVRASNAGANLDAARVAGLSQLLDFLWNNWIVGGQNPYARSNLLKRIAEIEAQSMASGIPSASLSHAEAVSLGDLIEHDLIVERNERLRFSHDLIGDWSRLRIVIGDPPTLSPESIARYSTVRWHRAVRLYGRWLIAQEHGVERWQTLVASLGEEPNDALTIRDLLLESICLTDNSIDALELAWPILSANHGHLLSRMLRRFLFVGTIPDPQLSSLAVSYIGREAAYWSRYPYWPFWPAIIRVMHRHIDDVVRIAVKEGAEICRLWLRKSPQHTNDGRRFPCRSEAANIGVRIAREVQASKLEGVYFQSGTEQIVYEAALSAASELPDEVSQLALELAQRRPLRADIAQRAATAREIQDEKRREWFRNHPEQMRERQSLLGPLRYRGRLRDPWPDGPHSRVDDAFQEACLDGVALEPLIVTRPQVAVEVLLAVCIEEPQHDDPNDYHSHQLYGVNHWIAGYPPMWFRGPFISLMRTNPEAGVTFAIRLVTFATSQWVNCERASAWRHNRTELSEAELSVEIEIDGRPRRLWGDQQVMKWHSDWNAGSQIVPAALMAVEQWFYETIENNEDVSPQIDAILTQGASLALIGVLIDIGKKHQHLFEGSLLPLLAVWVLYYFDLGAVRQLQYGNPSLIGWSMNSGPLAEIARTWHNSDHRKIELIRIGPFLRMTRESLRSFFTATVAHWQSLLDEHGRPRDLRLLIERFRPENYTASRHDEEYVRFDLVWPDDIEQDNQLTLEGDENAMLLIGFPIDCRMILDGERSLPVEQVQEFWDRLQNCYSLRTDNDADDSERCANAIAGGIAVLLCCHGNYIRDDRDKYQWCIDRLAEIANAPHSREEFESPNAIGEFGWDVFLAEAAIVLLISNAEDEIARQLVAEGMTAFHHAAMRRIMYAAFQNRMALGDTYIKLQYFVIRWSAAMRWAQEAAANDGYLRSISKSRDLLCLQFVDGTIGETTISSARLQNIARINKLYALREITANEAPNVDDWALPHRFRRRYLRVNEVGLDAGILRAGFNWLCIPPNATGVEADRIISQAAELLDLTLLTIPPRRTDGRGDADGLPNQFDNWVFAIVSRVVAQGHSNPRSSALWRRIIDLDTWKHEWIERFFWYWFSDGVRAAHSPNEFVSVWCSMIRTALENEALTNVAENRLWLSDIVSEMLGFHPSLNTLANEANFAGAIRQEAALFEQSANTWFRMPRVVSGFANFSTKPAYRPLLRRGVVWVFKANQEIDDYSFWRERDMDDHILLMLQCCWQHEQQATISDIEVRRAFLGLLNALSSRNHHGAMAFREHIVESIPAT